MKSQFLLASMFKTVASPWLPRKQRRSHKGERGVALAIAAFGFVVFLMAAGMAIDISHFYLAGTELQNAADASALAAASALDSTSAGVTKAVDNALATVNKFEFSQSTVTFARSDVKFAKNYTDLNGTGGMSEATAKASPSTVRFVKVTVPPKDIGVFFAKFALNADNVAMTRTAVAGQSESGASGDVSPNQLCNVYRVTMIEGQSSGDGSLDRTSSSCGSSFKYTPGCTYNVHLTPPCDSQLSYYELTDVDNGKTYTDWDDRIADRMFDCFWSGKVVPILTHPQAKNIKNGLNTFFDTYGGGLTSSAFPPDTNVEENITYAQYKAATSGSADWTSPSHTGQAGRRVMVLPIMQKNSFVALDPNGDFANVTFSRFGAFFLVKKPVINTTNNTADLKLEYIGDRITVGSGAINPTYTLNSTTGTNLAVPVLYR